MKAVWEVGNDALRRPAAHVCIRNSLFEPFDQSSTEEEIVKNGEAPESHEGLFMELERGYLSPRPVFPAEVHHHPISFEATG